MGRYWCLPVGAVILLLSAGCAADGDKAQWDEFWKDLRGDNMKMRSDPSGSLDRALQSNE
jgi:hypothetical protein